MDFGLDLPALFADFGLTAVVGGVTVRAYYDADYADPLGMAGNRPILLVATADLPAVAVGQAVTGTPYNYTVTGIEPDGAGVATTLILRRA